MLPIPQYENMPNCIINKNRVFQGEIVINVFIIHCQLKSILLLVKTTKKLGGTCASFLLLLLLLL